MEEDAKREHIMEGIISYARKTIDTYINDVAFTLLCKYVFAIDKETKEAYHNNIEELKSYYRDKAKTATRHEVLKTRHNKLGDEMKFGHFSELYHYLTYTEEKENDTKRNSR